MTAISSSDPLKVGDDLFTAGLISQETLAKLDLPSTPYQKSRSLVLNVLDQVKVVSKKLEQFMEILHRSIDRASYNGKYIYQPQSS